jgi:hypothetical protein
VLVSLEVFRGRLRPGRRLLAPLPSGSYALWFRCPLVPVPSDSGVRHFLGSPPPRRVRTPWAGDAGRPASPGSPARHLPSLAGLAVFPAAAPVPGPPVRARLPAGSAGPSRLPGPARMRTARPAREYDIGVSEWEPVPAGARGKGADRLALYRRV